jgi:hypothetical protein
LKTTRSVLLRKEAWLRALVPTGTSRRLAVRSTAVRATRRTDPGSA